jgi:hypothetical protein
MLEKSTSKSIAAQMTVKETAVVIKPTLQTVSRRNTQ